MLDYFICKIFLCAHAGEDLEPLVELFFFGVTTQPLSSRLGIHFESLGFASFNCLFGFCS